MAAVTIARLLTQAIAIASYAVIRELGEFYALAVIFGTAWRGVMPLYASLARDELAAIAVIDEAP